MEVRRGIGPNEAQREVSQIERVAIE